jgi:peroxiredoxin
MEMTDMEGQLFNLSDYRGKVLLLDFWPVWCKPCIAKFPDLKKMIQRFEDKPFAVIGINIDDANRVEQAKKVIADYELTWRQVVEGKGEFIPSYQVYGRMPERPMSFPIYVIIDELGFTRYATNDFLKIDRFLEAHFSNPEDPQNVLFIPLSQKRTQNSRPVISVDFSSQKVNSLMETEETIMPADIPAEARIGLLPNGTMLIVYPSLSSDKVHLILDSNRDFDLTNDEGKDIPVLDEPVNDDEQMTKMRLNINFASGGRGFYTFYFFAKKSEKTKDELFPEVLFRGFSQNQEGFFFVGKKEYSIEIQDPTGDFLFTSEDSTDPTVLKLKIKKKEKWITLHQGVRQIPIAGSFYRLRNISDQGQLVELEKEK